MEKETDWEDRDLVRRCIAGEEAGWRELVSRYQPVLRRVAIREWSRLQGAPSEDRIDEICARTYAKLVEDDYHILKTFRWECPLAAWLGGMARFMTKWLFREELSEKKKQRGREVFPAFDPVHPLERKEQSLLIREILADLPEQDRRLLLDVYVENRPYRDLADSHDARPEALMMRVSRLKKALLDRMKGFLSILLL